LAYVAYIGLYIIKYMSFIIINIIDVIIIVVIRTYKARPYAGGYAASYNAASINYRNKLNSNMLNKKAVLS